MSELVHGFQLLREEKIAELNTLARLYHHVKSGASFLSLINDDENKAFGITFRTPPQDSTGIPHIMEHSVLAGSQKYQVKEPFIELVKGSLNTFLNAFTYPDKTCYPVASQNVKDLYNLVDVYLDAVFYPLLTRHHLDQEGWHYELDEEETEISFKGVVFNEMKGAYSSPEGLLGKYTTESLFPQTHTYGQDSGGDPRVMHNLTYEQFKAFHQAHYHPSNSRIFFYGDDDPEERLRFLNEYLQNFEAQDSSHTAVSLVPLKDEPKRFEYGYAVDEDTEEEPKNYIELSWLLPAVDSMETEMGLTMLSHILSGTVGSPLRKALIESGLGEDMIGGGFSMYLRQPMFSVGLKGVAEENLPKVEQLIFDTLINLAQKGLDPEAIEASLNTIEFRLRENNTGSFPRGLALMLASLDQWLHDGDPLAPLKYEAPLQAVKQASQRPGYFESLLSHYLLENEHRSTVVLKPDPELSQRLEAEEKERLTQAQAQMTPAELEAIRANTAALKHRQETPDDPAELAKLPMLTLTDIERNIKTIPIDVSHFQGAEVVYHDLFTNGIVYFSLGMNLHTLPADLLPYVPLFSYALTEMGTHSQDYVKLSQRIGRTTGGVSASRMVSEKLNGSEAAAWLSVRGKATMSHAQDLLDIIQDVLLNVKLDNQERFRQMVLEEKASQEARLIPGGHGVVMGRLNSQFSEAGWASELMSGLEYLFFVRDLVDKVNHHWPAVLEKLEQIRQILVNRNHMLCNITIDEANWRSFRPQLEAILSQFPAGPSQTQSWPKPITFTHEGLTIPAQVNYVGKAVNLYNLGYTYHASISAITNHLFTVYLWERVRMRGGAYGGFATFNPYTGTFAQASYRDPNLLNTLEVYDGTADYLRQLNIDGHEVTKTIIGVIGTMDAYQLPDAKGYTSLTRHILGITDSYRQQKRDELLATTPAHFRQLGEALQGFKEQGQVVVLGAAEAIAKANESLKNRLTVRKIM